ncbi:MAG TPA: hypothetical protein PK156_39725 [Polyangium sp.]|nr:hypothetical protein [Polyangium sp.]
MNKRRNLGLFVMVGLGLSAGAAIGPGCSAGSSGTPTGSGSDTGSTSSSTGSSSGEGGEGGGGIFIPDGGKDALDDVQMNPCGTGCGPTELCDDFHVGLDDDCDGEADEGCSCSAGQVHFCFLGDPAYRGNPGCFDGTEKCSENGVWGPCTGGVHATPADQCFMNDLQGCHAIQSPPFLKTDLITGTGTFSADAVPGSESWTVQCPVGVSVCPAVDGTNPPDDFKPVQSGEYTVTYRKSLANGTMDECTYPLFVGARGLRVELSWEHNLGGGGVDLDLHVHQPKNTMPWGIGGNGAAQDCSFANCTIDGLTNAQSVKPEWFPMAALPPDPISWWVDPVYEKNNCYFAPRGGGQKWVNNNMGCHNPRLDQDAVTCDPNIMNPDNSRFCAPENINIDFPPRNEWFRIGVHYYSDNGLTYDVHPVVKVFCDGALAAELGSTGYYTPETPITFVSGEGSKLPTGNRFWMVADVAFRTRVGECDTTGCVVKPLYADPKVRTPLLTYDKIAATAFGPPYPAPP